MNKEIVKSIKSIFFVLIILTITVYVFTNRDKLMFAATSIRNYKNIDNIELKSDDNLKLNKNIYKFTVKNNNKEEIKFNIILANDYSKTIEKDCKILSNNYLQYHIKYNNEYNITRSVSLDGIIFKGDLKPLETRNFELQLWKNETKKNNYCYYPILQVEKI